MCDICNRMENRVNDPSAVLTKIEKVRRLIHEHGYTDGGHHKQWLIDQIWQIVFPENEDLEAWYIAHDDFTSTEDYPWDRGIAP